MIQTAEAPNPLLVSALCWHCHSVFTYQKRPDGRPRCYCNDCREEHFKQAGKTARFIQNSEKKGRRRFGATWRCQTCGKELTSRHRKRHCPECLVKRSSDRLQARPAPEASPVETPPEAPTTGSATREALAEAWSIPAEYAQYVPLPSGPKTPPPSVQPSSRVAHSVSVRKTHYNKIGLQPRVCPQCRNLFPPTHPQQRYCDLECRQAAERLRQQIRRRERKLGKEREAQVLTRKCRECGNSFPVSPGNRWYCEDACRERHKRHSRGKTPPAPIPTIRVANYPGTAAALDGILNELNLFKADAAIRIEFTGQLKEDAHA